MKNFFTLCMALVALPSVWAQNGTLDAGFNATGKIKSSNETANSIVVDQNQKTLVLGHDRFSSTKNIFLTRYKSDGSLDNSFGTNGQFINDLNNDYDYGRCVRALSNGKYLVCGQNSVGPYFRAYVIRINSNGTLDQSFGNNGSLVIDISQTNTDAWSMEVAPSGSIFIAGYRTVNSVLKSAIWKVKANGTLDANFGNSGEVLISSTSNDERLFSIDLDMNNNKIAVAGISYNSSNTPEGLVCLVDTSGNVVNGFNGTGIKKIVYGSNPTNLYDVCLKANEVLVAGNYMSSNGNQKALVVSCLLNGSMNTSFANNGYFDDATADLSGVQQVLKDCKGELYFGGYILYNGYKSVYVFKLKANGSLDQNFGTSGIFITRYNVDADEIIEAMAFSADSGIVAGGRINIGGSGGTGSGIMRLKINSCASTSIQQVAAAATSAEFTLFPNPLLSTDVLQLVSNFEGEISYVIYSSDGKLVANSKLAIGESIIQESKDLSPGVYHMVLQSAIGTKRLSFVRE